MSMNPASLIKHAYLIGVPGGYEFGTTHLEGVSKDLANIKRFLKSRKGGAWLEKEITVISNAHYCEIKN